MLFAQEVLHVLVKVHSVSPVAKCGVLRCVPCQVLKLMHERQKAAQSEDIDTNFLDAYQGVSFPFKE